MSWLIWGVVIGIVLFVLALFGLGVLFAICEDEEGHQ
jgi:hypothetical protein